MSGCRPLVSVVMTSYNGRPYLEEAVGSVLAQDYELVEVVVVDDGSTDGSRDVIRAYGDRIHAVMKENGGQTSAMNAGFAASSGDIVCFVDGDDALDPGAIGAAAALFEDPEVVKVHWPLREVDDHSRPTGPVWPPEPLPRGDQLALLLDQGPEACAFPPTSGNSFRRSFLDEHFPLPEFERELEDSPSASIDALLSMLAAGSGRVEALAEPMGSYRRHPGNTLLQRDIGYKLDRYARLTDLQYDVLVAHLRRRGIEADPERWKQRSWFYRRRRLLERIEAVVERGDPFVLVDRDWTELRWVAGLAARAFTERDGEYWGPPAGDAEAIAELERARAEGARAFVVTWLCRDFEEQYPGLFAHLGERYERVLDDELALIFSLERPARPGSPPASPPLGPS